MQLKNFISKIPAPLAVLFLSAAASVVIPPSCKCKHTYTKAIYIQGSITYASDTPQVSWNVLFKPGTDKAIREKIIEKIQDDVIQSYGDYSETTKEEYIPKFFPVASCPCDSLLYNIGFSSVNGSGGSVSKPPPVKNVIPGSGNYVDLSQFSDNHAISENDSGKAEYNPKNIYSTVSVKNIGIDPAKKLAIIDSGIDSLLFSPNARKLIWVDNPSPTIFNFLPFSVQSDIKDVTKQRHGSAVTASAIKAMDNANAYPKIMILKALDDNNSGTVFSVSCALSYAIQKKADVINLSLGYYGQADSILKHYLNLCATTNPAINVFVAAGNTQGHHNAADICDNISNNNELVTGTRLFYPACFSGELNNLTVVTQLRSATEPCFYQNYSNQFVSLGILNNSNCCAMRVGYINNQKYYEGSSFATPVASGLKMSSLLQSAVTPAVFWNSLIKNNAISPLRTVGGKYIEYSPVW
ncbi:MAG: S8 family serine peptidase [Ferruginibacter sp.]